ncbi:hypothetical protein [Peribacillus huizhouensis]|uniref:Uncharacterized protein n=1 Tax=Peribacillus huizhouensis TaxID=1501239 RepID=A0ABR6CSK1_9BACI|nr:hypothetical protein [Peribacillus huizhouensis]MBA9027585.1 hypothetical protein [Peribacillus huizhouensis]
MKLVNLPKEVAEAIEELREIGISTMYIAQNVGVKQGFGASGLNKYLNVINDWRLECAEKRNNELLSALVNGYVMEKTPEEKMLENFRVHENVVWFYEGKTLDRAEQMQERYSSGYISGVKDFAELYGIKIEGINA